MLYFNQLHAGPLRAGKFRVLALQNGTAHLLAKLVRNISEFPTWKVSVKWHRCKQQPSLRKVNFYY